jgi:CubicO group peptidase (beta-lactamase class C family)
MASASVAGRPLTSERAQQALEQLIAEHHIPGAGFAAAKDGQIVASAAAGVTNIDTGLRVDDSTIWQAGSIGKTYTTVLVMQLVDEGVLDLDAPVVTYIPDLRFADDNATRSITTRQLLSHTGGIDGDRIDETGAMFGRGDDAVRRYVASLSDLPQMLPPGKLWSYCNAGYIVLGRLVEVLRDLPFEQVLSERLLQPAGLTSTFCFAEDVVARNVAAGHIPTPDGGMSVSPIWALGRAGAPAGAVPYTTLGDLLGFAGILLRRGVAADGTRILSETAVAEMLRPHVECPERELLGGHWGLGVMMRVDSAPAVYGHDGNTMGQTAALRFIPERNLAYGLITNRHQANAAFGALCNAVVDDWAGIVTPRQRKPVEGLHVDNPERLAGTYANVAAQIEIELAGGVPTMSPRALRDTAEQLDVAPSPLRPLDQDTFVAHLDIADEDLQVAFVEPDAAGRPAFLHFGGRLYKRADPIAAPPSAST